MADEVVQSSVTEVVEEVKKVVEDTTTHTVKFTCCWIPWTLQISHTPTPSSQAKPEASS